MRKMPSNICSGHMMEGEDIFEPDDDGEDDGAKYFDFLRSHIDLGKGTN